MSDDTFPGLDGLLNDLAAHRHRALLWISATGTEATARASRLWQARPWQAPLWLGPSPGVLGVETLPATKARTRLGGEHDLVVFDAASKDAGFDPDAFGAVVGTLRAGGLLVLLTPTAWEKGTPAPDADYARLAAWPYPAGALSARYLARLARRLMASPQVLHWPAGQAFPRLPRAPAAPPGPDLSDRPARDSDCLSADQADAVARLMRLRRRRPLVLSADRGRGKSAALGIAAARRLLAGERQLWVTAPRPAAVEPLFERLAALLPQGRREGNSFQVVIDGTAGGISAEVCFIAPDALLETLQSEAVDPRSTPTLFVDEAAAIPAPLLGRWLRAFPRIAYATTVHGYEGTGRGFQLRFRARLERDTPDWRELHLGQPIRWAEGDPLETLTRELLLLDAEPADDARVAQALAEHEPRLASLDRATLASDEATLSELFGLLVQAHYRTTPADLRQLLDAPATRLIAAYAGKTCLGVCLAQIEGGFPTELATAIQQGERRPRGHLLAQSLATHGGQREAAEARWCRILRIAVHPGARRRGLGRGLIECLGREVASDDIARLGVSFGAESELVAFWRAQGFVSLRLGLSREASSGEHALMMGKALDEPVEALIAGLNRDFRLLLPSLLAFELRRLDAELAATLLREGPPPAIDAETLERVAWFAAGGGELASVRPWLATAWLAWWRRTPQVPEDDAPRELVAPLFLGKTPWTTPGDVGRKALLRRWRVLAGRLTQHLS
ncbi:tRNA(Met)-cytidine N(4)-acetyltransferase [Modicisalibacter ilicicola DSM 19980]|uniref:tRNA(Met) cytidine acetyltransferase TmcA n=1 Tax=Modicisalibacter ilicicola DSM 19980 TaxID=1121942 RepID=A0A1M5EGI1_9GAMM|nr:GNAT family N-acetyltransferase [Halomonas ilicicola]SHF78296.1 tRNA(Met)-cytidine N(4)-acetyltransferase [Halomonas ilicicola DSM 19980]